MHMEVDMCRTDDRLGAILKEALHYPKGILDMLLQATVTHQFWDKLRPIRLKEAIQRTPSHMSQILRAMSVRSNMPLHRLNR